MVKRFVDNNWFSYSYAHYEKVWGKCLKCGNLALIWREKIEENYVTQYVCTNCTFRVNEIVKESNLYYSSYWHSIQTINGYFGKIEVTIDKKCDCKEGKFRFTKTYANKSQIPNCISVNCNFCGQARDFYTKSDEVKMNRMQSFGIDTDPFFLHYVAVTQNIS